MSGKHLNPFQHALQRPDAYIGSIKTIKTKKYIFDVKTNKVTESTVRFNKGLHNIIREISSNCIDNNWRSQKESMPMKSIKVTYNEATNYLVFWNDGMFIPAEKFIYEYEDHHTGKIIKSEMYPAEKFFGDMLTGTNFEDHKERKTSGRNGMGASLVNIFSIEFIVRHTDSKVGKQFLQTYTNNGKTRSTPKITSFKGKIAFTEITFKPDYERFNYDIDKSKTKNDFKNLLGMHLIEVAAVTGLPVTFTILKNEEDTEPYKQVFHYKTFDKFSRMLYPDLKTNKLGMIKLPNGDDCVIIESHIECEIIADLPDTLDEVRHFSFVNGIHTYQGGIHVDAWRDAIIPAFVRVFNAKPVPKGSIQLKTSAKEVYPYITLFIRTEINGPSFDEQFKDRLNGPDYQLVSSNKNNKMLQTKLKEELDDLIAKMMKWNFVSALQEKLLRKNGGIKSSKPKERLDLAKFGKKVQDANNVNSEPHKCTLYITEGLSAKALIVGGISAIEDGHDYNGVFAVQGKFINASKFRPEAIKANDEASALMEMLNLQIGKKYSTPVEFKNLRYHNIRIATDADDDGIHIRGLLINFFYTFWPELIKNKVVTSFSTGVSQIVFKNKKLNDLIFYSKLEYEKWYNDGTNDTKKIERVKYLKGLGNISSQDIPYYFIDPKIVKFFIEGTEKEFIKLAFDTGANSKESCDLRKKWLLTDELPDKFVQKYRKNNKVDLDIGSEISSDKSEKSDENNLESIVDGTEDSSTLENTEESKTDKSIENFVYEGDLGLSTFINKQLIIYHKMTFRRCLPHLIDGLKEAQRKCIYAIRLKNYKFAEVVERVGGAVAEITSYHHGSASLFETIVKLADRYPGSNNIALLEADGQFNTRLEGDDHSGPRYLSTKLENISEYIFPRIDDVLLNCVVEDNKKVEYEFLLPIICLLLVNGSTGIATAFSTNIPNYNPIDIVNWTRKWLKNDQTINFPSLVPWYREINGKITLEETNKNLSDSKEINPSKFVTSGIVKECGKGCKVKLHYYEENGKTKKKKIVSKNCEGEPGWWHILDLPIGMTTNKAKEELHKLIKSTKSEKENKACISDIREYNTPNRVNFMIKPMKSKITDGTWDPNFKFLTTTKTLKNMVAIDSNNYPTRYETPEDILSTWCPIRLSYYQKRYDYMVSMYVSEIEKISNKYKFVELIVTKQLDMHQSDAKLEENMTELKLIKIGDSYDYLLSMQMRSMTKAKLKELKSEVDKLTETLTILKGKSSKDLWLEDLDAFEVEYTKYLEMYPLIP